MIHGLLFPQFMALTIAVCATLAYPVNCQRIFAHTPDITSTENDPLMANTGKISLDHPLMMTTPASAAYLAITPPHHQPMFSNVPLMVSPLHSIDFPDHQPKMMAAGAGYSEYLVLDEFGKQTTLPFKGGDTINITDTTGRILLSQCCTNCTNVDQRIPSGFVSRLAERPDQCVNNLYCGFPTEPYFDYHVCLDHPVDGKLECGQFKGHAYNHAQTGHNTKLGSNLCTRNTLYITYSKKNGTQVPLLPGTLIMVMIEDGGVQLYAKHKKLQTYLICKTVTKEHLHEYAVNGTDEVTINPEHQLMVDGIVRVDCEIAIPSKSIVDEWTNATTYFFIGNGELKVDEKCKHGKPSCSVPAWVNEYMNPVINYGTEEGLTCTAQFTICFPKTTTETMSTKVAGPNCTEIQKEPGPESMNLLGKATTGFLLMIALAVVMLMVCLTVILGIAYWLGSKQTRTLSGVPVKEMLNDGEEKKMSCSGSVNAVGHMDEVITPEYNAALANAPLEEALKDNDKSFSVADAHNDKEDMVTARDTA